MVVNAALRSAVPDDLGRVVALLEHAGLPAADITPDGLADFMVAHDAAEIIGVAGLERHGEHGLLRSLAVAPDWRGRGLGAALVEAIEAKARALGVRSLLLLTRTAAPLFAARGYEEITRSQAPAAVQASTEFTVLCPASSTCMQKIIH
ncbi:MAG TPA: arsenic resistance N-acetyltransferase ArsN2 [Burkholderiaceae bacterium]|nr:arsenic resistance N-acetyltransferase ArsN2 [Burkholderiaceae bacterium]HQR75361.1 arsenic resistance N-acetyltransferase ArsN2 [Burkholderiaceae bacterium]